MDRFTKIVATIGPSSQSKECIKQLINAGVNVTRLNFSHGSHEDHRIAFNLIREVAKELNVSVMILQDLQGPKLRTGKIENGEIELFPGEKIKFTSLPILGTKKAISIDFPQFHKYAKPGFDILIDDGNISVRVLEVGENWVTAEVIQGGILKSHKGVNFPGIDIDIPGFTSKDRDDLKFGLEIGIDAVAISFVRSENDIYMVQEAINEFTNHKYRIPIIAKLERPEALKNLENILNVVDGVMVARGDLGVEMRPEEVPIVQKRIIAAANKHFKYCITATQMLESMIEHPRPTRAETSDVANAIFDGTDAVMLSGETAVGKFPIQSVAMMDAVIRQAEQHLLEYGDISTIEINETIQDDAYFITRAAKELAKDRNVAAIAVFTQSGRSAFIMSKNRPSVPIIAFTPNITTYNKLSSYWGVYPRLVEQVESIEMMLKNVDVSIRKDETPIKPGQQVVLICGFPISKNCPANLALLHTVGE